MEIHMKPACNQDRVYRELLPELKGDSMPGRGSASWFKEGSWAGVFTGLGDASVFPRHVILRAARSPELTHFPLCTRHFSLRPVWWSAQALFVFWYRTCSTWWHCSLLPPQEGHVQVTLDYSGHACRVGKSPSGGLLGLGCGHSFLWFAVEASI